ncbi:MAG: hypothetical protein ACI87E_003319 [Mariniblastus sp.]|jgi:hypothetical protein
MGWRSPPSIKAALNEATQRWPKRSKLSDGAFGYTAHSHRKSDHNPATDGDIHTYDLTHDPTNVVDCNLLTAHLVKRRDKRVKYIIWNSRICRFKNWTRCPTPGPTNSPSTCTCPFTTQRLQKTTPVTGLNWNAPSLPTSQSTTPRLKTKAKTMRSTEPPFTGEKQFNMQAA